MTSHFSQCAAELREIAVILAKANFYARTPRGSEELCAKRDNCYKIARFFESIDRATQEPKTMSSNNSPAQPEQDAILGVCLRIGLTLEKILKILETPMPIRYDDGKVTLVPSASGEKPARFYAERDKFCSHCGKPRMQYLGSGCPVGGCPVGEDH